MTRVTQEGRIEFRFFRPQAAEVAIAADFNGWSRDSLLMERDEQGWWSATVALVPGEYRFRYLADGQWFTDFASHGIEYKRNGPNSMLFVPETAGVESYTAKIAA